MHLKSKITLLTGLLCLMLPASLRAGPVGTTYTYAGGSMSTSWGTVELSISMTTSLTGSGLSSLAPGTDISSSLTSFTMTPSSFATQDEAGFPYSNYGFIAYSPSVVIGTNSVGGITSWNVSQNLAISYPAFSGENPYDFYAEWQMDANSSGDSMPLIVDNDAGFSPPGTSSPGGVGTWSPDSIPGTGSTPEPTSCALLGLGMMGIAALRARRKTKAAIAVDVAS